jgi:hypothetical protein
MKVECEICNTSYNSLTVLSRHVNKVQAKIKAATIQSSIDGDSFILIENDIIFKYATLIEDEFPELYEVNKHIIQKAKKGARI